MVDHRVVKYDKSGQIVSDETETIDTGKTVYSNVAFRALIPANKYSQIDASTNDDVIKWKNLAQSLDPVNLNMLPEWFTVGLNAMVTDGILTQQQVDNFLEV